MDKYKYPIFFEVSSRIDREGEKKISNYFKIRRTSGGGECGSVEKVVDNLYKISFRDQEDQQRVLNKSQHVLELPEGPELLTVRGKLDLSSPTSPAATSSLASQQFIPVSTLSPSGVDYELQFDTYILRYLVEEHPKAWKELQQELSTLGCSIKLHPDDGKLVILGGCAQAGLNLDKWKVKVENLWECYYEVDLSKRQLLLQSAASQGQGDGVRVYSEAGEGFAVVVGGRSEVQARLRELEPFEVQVEEPRVTQEEVKTVLRLGEAKLSLLWEKIEREIGYSFPEMKVAHGEPGHLLLEGTPVEVRRCAEWVSSLEPLVLETVVPEISPGLLSFLRHTYGGLGDLEAVLGLGGQVKLELGDTELRVLALTPDMLSQAQVALRGEFREETIDIPNCSTIPAELRAQLESQQLKMNRNGLRVLVKFDTGCSVVLLGHAKEVDKLQDDVGDHLLEHSSVEDTLRLPEPDMAEYLPDIVESLGLDLFGMTIAYAPGSVVFRGPSRKVRMMKGRLGLAVDDMVAGAGQRFPSSRGSCEDLTERSGPAMEGDFQGGSSWYTRLDGATAAGSSLKVQCPEIAEIRMVFLGKTGIGKSSSANTIYGEHVFTADNSPNPVTQTCETWSKIVGGRNLVLVDTPGFFARESSDTSDGDLKQEVMQCVMACAPGPHAFIIVLKVDRYTAHERQAIDEIARHFSPEAFRFATVLFTHGGQLDGERIEEFVDKSEPLRGLVKRCGGRCHVVDNKHWRDQEPNGYRSNTFQVEELLNTIDKMVEENDKCCYTNEMLRTVTEDIREEEENIRRQSPWKMSENKITETARKWVWNKYVTRFAGFTTGAVLGALLGAATTAQTGNLALIQSAAVKGSFKGAGLGWNSAMNSETLSEAAVDAAKAVYTNAIKGIPP